MLKGFGKNRNKVSIRRMDLLIHAPLFKGNYNSISCDLADCFQCFCNYRNRLFYRFSQFCYESVPPEEWEQKQEANQKRLHDLAVMQSRADAQESEVRTFIKEIRRYSAIEVLDEAVLNRLISKILIGEVKKVDGQKVQEVRIVYNFVGEIPEIAT